MSIGRIFKKIQILIIIWNPTKNENLELEFIRPNVMGIFMGLWFVECQMNCVMFEIID